MNGIVASTVLDYFEHSKSPEEIQLGLTEPERQICRLLFKGNNYKALAATVEHSLIGFV